MARTAVTYGFGRVSTKSRPSPYSPLPRASQVPGMQIQPRRTLRAGGGSVFRAIAAAALFGALVGVAAYFASVYVRDTGNESPVVGPAQAQKPLSDEAERLSRSAIAVGRYTPRRGS